MGLIQRLFKKHNKVEKEEIEPTITYDVNANITEYTEEQIQARIKDELGSNALVDYQNITINDNELAIKWNYLNFRKFEGLSFLLNEFYVEAIRLKLKRELYANIKNSLNSSKSETISIEEVKQRLDTIDEVINNSVSKAEEERQTVLRKKEKMSEIDKLFAGIINSAD